MKKQKTSPKHHVRKIVKKVKQQKKKPLSKPKKKVVAEKKNEFTELPPVKKKRRARKPRSTSLDKMYFTKDTEDAIVAYNHEEEKAKREIIYNTRIKYAFEKLVENVFNTFKFSYFEVGPADAQKEAVAHLAANMDKFDQARGSKAFSYFSIIAKNYLIAENNKNYIRFQRQEQIGEDREEHTVQLQSEDKHHKDSETKEFMRLMIEFWENNVNRIFNKQRDLDIANAVIELFRQSERIDAFNKKALYLYIREISSCKTQQITKVINKMKQYQTNIAKSWINTGSINTESYMKV